MWAGNNVLLNTEIDKKKKKNEKMAPVKFWVMALIYKTIVNAQVRIGMI